MKQLTDLISKKQLALLTNAGICLNTNYKGRGTLSFDYKTVFNIFEWHVPFGFKVRFKTLSNGTLFLFDSTIKTNKTMTVFDSDAVDYLYSGIFVKSTNISFLLTWLLKFYIKNDLIFTLISKTCNLKNNAAI